MNKTCYDKFTSKTSLPGKESFYQSDSDKETIYNICNAIPMHQPKKNSGKQDDGFVTGISFF